MGRVIDVKEERKIDIEAMLADEVENVIVIKNNEPNIDLMAEAFYDIYIKA
jgi:hypothetical protein